MKKYRSTVRVQQEPQRFSFGKLATFLIDKTPQTMRRWWAWLTKINMARVLVGECLLFGWATVWCIENYPALVALPSSMLFISVFWGATYLLMRYGFKKIDTQANTAGAIKKGHVYAQEIHFGSLYILPGLILFFLIILLTGG